MPADPVSTSSRARDIAIIRTHEWGEAEALLAEMLRQSFAKVVTVFHNPPVGLDCGVEMVPLTDDWVRQSGLRLHPRYGWLCGDYAYYAAREAFPDYDRYWLIETDVWLQGDSSAFFSLCAASPADALAAGIRDARGNLNPAWIRSVTPRTPIRAYFPLTRLSGRAIDRLFAARVDYAASAVRDGAYCNNSLFVFTWLHEAEDLTYKSLEQLAPAWFEKSVFLPDPDILRDAITALPEDAIGAWHPVRSREDFIRIAAERAARAMGKSIGFSALALGPDDIAAIGAEIAKHLERQIARGAKLHENGLQRPRKATRAARTTEN